MRYLPFDATDRAQMLTRIGAPDIDALFADIPPPSDSPRRSTSRTAWVRSRSSGA